VIKVQFGYRKVRYRGLEKNTGQLQMLVALTNLYLARLHLLAATGSVRPEAAPNPGDGTRGGRRMAERERKAAENGRRSDGEVRSHPHDPAQTCGNRRDRTRKSPDWEQLGPQWWWCLADPANPPLL